MNIQEKALMYTLFDFRDLMDAEVTGLLSYVLTDSCINCAKLKLFSHISDSLYVGIFILLIYLNIPIFIIRFVLSIFIYYY